ncbi:hypothetical protein RRG08_039937 [Elysia crispata]|uniref:ISXO2-like transposase domain-containing protein n=1 Tax=Elysia crispata TaxID=231223 RepID=A0AAE1BAP2_9GAST|nr:hypothetical protein RRG08_039937 [Elysia crispata]
MADSRERRKYHRGLWREGHWVFGAIERRSKQCILVEVPDRAAATLEPIIRRWILPGSHIISDGWAAYANIDQIGNGIYTHSVVVHERHFVDPDHPAIHTQLIENTRRKTPKRLFSDVEATQLVLDDDEFPDGSDDERLADDSDNDPDFEMCASDCEVSSDCDSENEDGDGDVENGHDDGDVQNGHDDGEVNNPRPEIQTQPPQKKQKSAPDNGKKVFHWVKKDLPPHVNPPNRLIPAGKAASARGILTIFTAFCDDDALDLAHSGKQ